MPRKVTSQKKISAPVVLVAGGAGFLGSHLCESLLSSGATVLALDDLVTGSLANLTAIKRHPHFEFFECNINQGIPAALLERPITHIVHAVGAETHAGNEEATLASLLTNAFGTKNLLDAAVATGAKFVLTSSINVYEGLASSASLNYYFGSTVDQEAQFSQFEAKRYAETLCEMYAREYNLDVRVARLSQVYGPRMDLTSQSLLSRLIKMTLQGQDLLVEEEGSQEVLLTYISDVVYGLSRLMFADGEMFSRSIYALANPEKVSVISVAYTLRGYLPHGKEVQFVQRPAHSAFALPKVSLDRVKKDLDWEPVVGVTEGLKLTIEYFKQAKDAPQSHQVSPAQLSTTMPLPQPASTPPAASSPQAPKVQDTAVPAPKAQPGSASTWDTGLKFRAGMAPAAQAAKADASSKLAASTLPSAQTAATESELNVSSPKPRRVRSKVPSWWRRVFFGATVVLIYLNIGRPMLQTTAYAAAGALDLRQGVAQTKALQLDLAQRHFSQASRFLAEAQSAWQPLGWLAGLLGQSGTFGQVNQGFSSMAMVSDGLSTLAHAGQPLVGQMQQLAQFNKSSSAPADIAGMSTLAQTSIRQAQHQFGQALALLSSTDASQVAGASVNNDGQEHIGVGLLSSPLAGLRTLLVGAQASLDQADHVLEVLPEVLGASGKKTYLIMLENSNELRPTGGFMGSYAVVEVDQGRITRFGVDDIYNPDGQLHSTLPAPVGITAGLGSTQMFWRDSNWSPDAPSSAQQVAQLYREAVGAKVDGVIFVTTQAVEPLLRAMGPMHLDQYNETVTADNFDTLAQVHSDVGFVPGSTAKKDFLGLLAQSMIGKVESGDRSLWAPLAKSLVAGLAAKEVQMYAINPAVQTLIDQQDWSGRMWTSEGDYLRVVDANVGSNKANYFITRSTDYAINVDRNSQLHAVVKITWKHSGTSGTWPGGDYLNYVRVYAPKGAVLTSWDNFQSAAKLDVATEGDKVSFGGLVSVPYHSTKTVVVRYDLPERLGLVGQSGNYALMWQKQSGLPKEALTVRFNAPVFLQPQSISSMGQLTSDGVVWASTAGNDQDFKLHLTAK